MYEFLSLIDLKGIKKFIIASAKKILALKAREAAKWPRTFYMVLTVVHPPRSTKDVVVHAWRGIHNNVLKTPLAFSLSIDFLMIHYFELIVTGLSASCIYFGED